METMKSFPEKRLRYRESSGYLSFNFSYGYLYPMITNLTIEYHGYLWTKGSKKHWQTSLTVFKLFYSINN